MMAQAVEKSTAPEAELWGLWVFPSDAVRLHKFFREGLKLNVEGSFQWSGGFSETRYIAGHHRIGVITSGEELLKLTGGKRGIPVFTKFHPIMQCQVKARFASSQGEAIIYAEEGGEFTWVLIRSDHL